MEKIVRSKDRLPWPAVDRMRKEGLEGAAKDGEFCPRALQPQVNKTLT